MVLDRSCVPATKFVASCRRFQVALLKQKNHLSILSLSPVSHMASLFMNNSSVLDAFVMQLKLCVLYYPPSDFLCTQSDAPSSRQILSAFDEGSALAKVHHEGV